MKTSGIITLLSDFGNIDAYVAMMKGVILRINPQALIIDIGHQINAGSIHQAAKLINETFPFFPKGTVHNVVVDPGVGSQRRLMGVEAGGHIFVGPDNGVLWPVIQGEVNPRIIQLTEDKYYLPHVTRTFHGRDVFAPVAAHLSLGIDLGLMGPVIKDPVTLSSLRPRIIEDTLYGEVIHFDYFGNLITNISINDLEGFLKKSKPRISIGNLEIFKVDNIYADVEEGEPLAIINSSDWLEIAVNMGRATEYIGTDSSEIVGKVIKVNRYE